LMNGIVATVAGTVQVGAWEVFYMDVTEYHVTQGVEISIVRTSKVGDPDLYLNYVKDGFPTLSSHRWASTQCEPCGASTSVILAPTQFHAGRLRIAVFGYCCEAAEFRLEVRVPKTSRFFFIGIIGFPIGLFCLLLVFLYFRCWKRLHRPALAHSKIMFSAIPLEPMEDPCVVDQNVSHIVTSREEMEVINAKEVDNDVSHIITKWYSRSAVPQDISLQPSQDNSPVGQASELWTRNDAEI
jgi:hypothetical protein